jgi:catechol-2,3-dioxygenase
MNIDELEILTPDLSGEHDFYSGVLGLPGLAITGDSLSVQVGSSRLTFGQAPGGWNGFYHFAFNIPENQFREAKSWVSRRAPLIRDSQGADEFHFESWNAHSLYFYDPAGNILELIARHNLDNGSEKPFDPQSILSISEIGLASDDVPGTVRTLQEGLGIEIYDGPGSDTFTATGDEHGLLIVVKRSRIWFPETGKPAGLLPLAAVISTHMGKRFKLSAHPNRPLEITNYIA